MLTVLGADALHNRMTARWEDLPQTDRQVLEELAAYRAADRSDPVWDGHDVTAHPLLLMNRDTHRAYLVNPTHPVGTLLAPAIELPEQLQGFTVHRLDRGAPRLLPLWALGGNFNTIGQTATVLGNDVYYLKYDAGSLQTPRSSEHFMPFLAHESFHFIVQEQWAQESRFERELSAAGMDLLAQRLEVLEEVHTALEADSPDIDRLRALARRLVEIDAQRETADPRYVADEQWMETVGGTAEFMSVRAARIVDYPFGVMTFDNADHAPFTEVVPTVQSGQVKPSFLRDRLPYESGAQSSLLLDAIGPEGTWQRRLSEQTPAQRVTLAAVLAEAVR